MCENLINDLLDLAKLENSSFKFDNDYFSLPGIIYQAFQILGFSASERCVDLRAKIDCKENLNLIESIHGDQRRFLQIFLNFMSNSLKFTDKGGKVTIDIKVLDHQKIHSQKSAQDIENFLLKEKKSTLKEKDDSELH